MDKNTMHSTHETFLLTFWMSYCIDKCLPILELTFPTLQAVMLSWMSAHVRPLNWSLISSSGLRMSRMGNLVSRLGFCASPWCFKPSHLLSLMLGRRAPGGGRQVQCRSFMELMTRDERIASWSGPLSGVVTLTGVCSFFFGASSSLSYVYLYPPNSINASGSCIPLSLGNRMNHYRWKETYTEYAFQITVFITFVGGKGIKTYAGWS